MNNSGDGLSIPAIMESLFRHKGKLFLYNLLVIAGIVMVILFFPRTYASEAKIWLKLGRQNAGLDPTASIGPSISVQKNDREDEIKSVLDVIISRGVVETAVDELTPEVVLGNKPLSGQKVRPSNPITEGIKNTVGSVVQFVRQIDPVSERERAIREVQQNIEADAERKSNVVSVLYEADSPELAQAVVDVVMKEYTKRHNRIHHTDGSQTFFEEQRGLLNERVEKASNALKEAKDSYGIASIEGQQSILENELQSVRNQALSISQRVAESDALVGELESLLDENPQYIEAEVRSVPNTGRDGLENTLLELQVDKIRAEQTLKPDHPRRKLAEANAEQAAQLLSTMATTERVEKLRAVNKVHQELSLDLAKARASRAGYAAGRKTLAEQEEDLLKQISQLNHQQIRVKELQRELALAESNFMTYSEKFENARVDEALNISAFSNLGVAQPPTFQERPVSPSKLLVAILGAAAMVAGTIGLLVFFHLIVDQGKVSGRDLERIRRSMDIPIAVSMPRRLSSTRLL